MKFEVKWKRGKKERNFLIVLSIVFAVFWVLGNYEVLGFSGLSLICVCTARVILYSIILYIFTGELFGDKILAFEMMDSKEERKKSKKVILGNRWNLSDMLAAIFFDIISGGSDVGFRMAGRAGNRT